MAVERIGVIGAGTMGSGIAQVAALGEFEVRIFDAVTEMAEAGAVRIGQQLSDGVQRHRWTEPEAEAASGRVEIAESIGDLAGCDLVIEAAPEDLDLKRRIFGEVAESCGPQTLLATNTSSLRVGDIAAGVPGPERLIGMHFFNPPPLMRLVEVVAAPSSAEEAVAEATAVALRMKKTPIRARDTPGFVANRLARPFSLESLRMLGDDVASVERIDRIVRLGGGFRMGPFELIDLIGLDVNLEIARSFFAQGGEPERWRPSPIQEELVAAGRLGRKSGHGYYEYGDGHGRELDPELGILAPTLEADKLSLVDPLAEQVLTRLFAQIANETAFALEEEVAAAPDMDTAMQLGLNWPLGPLSLAAKVGSLRACDLLEDLRAAEGEAYAPAPLLHRAAERGIELRDLRADELAG
jgi:3-hydroxybutyryl-CoA dehydrogenase